MPTAIKNNFSNTVFGKVTDINGRALPNLVVSIFDVDMREWQELGNTTTAGDGNYEIRWGHEQLKGREKLTADIALKVSTKEHGTELFKTVMGDVRFNAAEREEINVVLKTQVPNESIEFETLLRDTTYLAGKVAITDLQESKEHKDITFLSKELSVPADKLEHLVVAHRMAKITNIEADFFYALLRKNTLLRNNFTDNLSARITIGLESDEQILIYDTALVDSEIIERDIKSSIEEMLISPSVGKKLAEYLRMLSQYKPKAEDYYKNDIPNKTIEFITNFFRDDKLSDVQKLFESNKNDLTAFINQVTDPDFYKSRAKENGASKNLELGKLFGFGNKVILNVAKSRNIKNPQDIRNLAKLNKAEWVTEIRKANPEITDENIVNTYASTFVRKLEAEFPTLAFAAQLEREDKKILNKQKEVVAFFNKHMDFNLEKDNVDLYLKANRVDENESEAIKTELKSLQRVFKLVPNYKKTIALRNQNIQSSHSIVAAGQSRFVKEIAPKAGISELEAKKIYNIAETRHTAAMMLIGDLNDSISVMDIASFETKSLALKIEAISEDFPNLKSLFKLTDSCECEHCRSVYSPAAYLVEILQFLDKRTVLTGNAKDILFSRRPELGEIDLGCANATTPVKYIDLVCEILEEAIASDNGIDYSGNLSDGPNPVHGKISTDLYNTLIANQLPVTTDALIHESESHVSSATLPRYLRDKKLVCKIVNTVGNNYKIYRLRQTFGTAEELDAAPEYINNAAYQELKNKYFAFGLPFDLYHTEAKAYFNRFDIKRAELMRAFQTNSTPDEEEIATETLGLSKSERLTITLAPNPNNNAAQQAFWNAPAPGIVLDYIKQVDNFLDRTSLNYNDLDLLLKLKFIDKNGNLFIKHKDLTCDTSEKEIENLDLDSLDRIHRFLRLQKKTGWKIDILDEIISQNNLGNGDLDEACLVKAAFMKEISDKTKIKIDELIGCFQEIAHKELYDGHKPLYHQIFLNKAKNGIINNNFLPEFIDGSQVINSHLGYIATCLQLKQKDLEFLTPILPDSNLTFENLSILYAASRIIKRMKVKSEDFAIIIELCNIDFTASPEEMFKLIELINQIKLSTQKPADIKFLLNHEASNIAAREINDIKVTEILTNLKNGYAKINEEFKSKYDDNLSAEEQTETLINVLSVLNTIEQTHISIITKFLRKNWSDVTDATGAKTFIDDNFDSSIDRNDINNAIDALDAAPVDNNEAEQKAFIQAILDSVSIFQIQMAKSELLNITVSTSFKAEPDLTEAVLKFAVLKQIAPGSELITDLLYDDFTNPITPANYSKQFSSVRLLHKIFGFLNAIKLPISDVEWYFENNSNPILGWLEFDGLPFESGQTSVDIMQYLHLMEIINYSKQFNPVVNPLDAENPITFYSILNLIITTSSRDEFLYALSTLTGYEQELLDEIDAYLFLAFDITEYSKAENWNKLLLCAEYARKLGASVAQIREYIKPELTINEVNDLRATLKSRYDEDTWLSTLKEIMDAIRPQKRDALVDYLLATNSDIKDTNDLYEYFLVDVQMEACMPSSRIVQAHNSIQLFVQRCLMGLEPDAIADVDNDPNWNQWQWMKNYRVWEANRKVFLYPENWYDVTLSDEKSFLLDELINEVQQNELTNDTAEEALKMYLEKLDKIAFLEVMATWYDTKLRNMHVFARTKGGDPAIYYYRRFEKERYWTPWEKIELDIAGDHLLAFMRNDRLCLAWPVFTEEAQPEQKSKMPTDSQKGTYVDQDKPKKKLKIQLAISEYTNKKWQPKRVSSQGIMTPYNYTSDDSELKRDSFNLMYIEFMNQIWIISSYWDNGDYHQLRGIFDIAGCKGYPELLFEGNQYFYDFYPDFKDSLLNSQKYKELVSILPDELAVRNGKSPFSFYNILNQTPGQFRITYPHQFTNIDLIALFFQWLFLILNSKSSIENFRRFKIPLGTMLPYFKENSRQAYVIIPGFYKKDNERVSTLNGLNFTDVEKRTASNIFQLIDDIINWFKKISADFQSNPPADITEAIQRILTDSDFQSILEELTKYMDLDFILNWMIGKGGSDEFDEYIKNLIEEEPLVYGEQFKNMYHPLVCALRSILYKSGIPELMKRDTQLQVSNFNFETYYIPNQSVVPKGFYKNPDGTSTASFPIEDVDFTSDGSYSLYNWDLFFRVPLYIASGLTQNQRFEEALTWFHYMFNPTGALPGNGVQKYWVTKPFYLNQDTDYISQRIDSIMYNVAEPNNPNIAELEFAIDEWRAKPFRPDVIARFRPVAYQKALLMKYIDNLTEWGDYLFRQDTMESVAQATQMYILADKLLGPKPRIVPSVVKQPYETYNQIEAKLDSFGNALIELENILPDLSVLPESGNELPAPPVTLSMLYFCIPANEKMFEYWDRVADRLFKIRNCQNIDGVERSLALFAPPIDPGMLVKAAASGLDLSSIIAGLNAPTPFYRFNVLSQKAGELAQEIRNLGNSLLQALEKKDAEAMALLRSELEIRVLNAVKDIKKLHIDESLQQIEILKSTYKVTEERYNYYKDIEKVNSYEEKAYDKQKASKDYKAAAQGVKLAASLISLLPDIDIGASGWAASPVAKIKIGGLTLGQATNAASDILSFLSLISANEAESLNIKASRERRYDDWKFQERLASKELEKIEKQIQSAEIRKEIAETEFKNHELQIENAKKTYEFMRSKFTNKELYDWMIGQISSVYFKSYKLAHDFAKKAERCYRFELGNDDSYISYGYWDSMKKGLLAANNLIHDIKRMETGYLDKNKREYEITKHVSLAQLDPLALVRLRASGTCDFDIPEVLYDMDHPGHYFRRLKTVGISLPCIAGPYTSISAKLSLVSNKYRKNTNDAANYAEDIGNDSRFVYNIGAIQSIATSHAQNDSGVFELNFRDERYLPFENTGAISSWRLELPTEVKQFDYNTISDVILHIKYTAREGGSILKNAANEVLIEQLELIKQSLNQEGLHIALNMKHDLSNEWHLLKHNSSIDLVIDKSRLPYMAQAFDAEIASVMFIAKVTDNPASFTITIDGGDLHLSRIDELQLCSGISSDIEIGESFTLSLANADLTKLEELMMVVNYTF